MAIMYGVEVARAAGFSTLIVESDSLTSIKAVHGSSSLPIPLMTLELFVIASNPIYLLPPC